MSYEEFVRVRDGPDHTSELTARRFLFLAAILVTTLRTGEELRCRDEVTGRNHEHRGVRDTSRGGEARDDLAHWGEQHP